MWDAFQQTYSKARDMVQVYEDKVEIIPSKHGSKKVKEFPNQLKAFCKNLSIQGD